MHIRSVDGVAYRPMRFRFDDTLLRPSAQRSAQFRFGCAALLVTATLAGCSQPPGKRSKEYFPSSIYGAASPRVVEDGEPVPRGGGRYLVGKPYSVAGRVYTPKEVATNTSVTGKASWYGAAFHGRRTSNGEVYDMRSVSAAHPTWPLPSYVRITNTRNGRSMIARLNDRGPFHSDRVMDVSSRVAEALDFKRFGTAVIKVDYVGKAGLAGSDDQILMASLRTDGRPAALDGNQPTMVADMESEAAPAAAAPTRLSLFQSRPDPQPESEVTTIDRQEPTPLSSAGGMAAIDVLPPPRPAWLQPIKIAEAQTVETKPSAPVAVRTAAYAPLASGLPQFPPLPPIRPLSLGIIRPSH